MSDTKEELPKGMGIRTLLLITAIVTLFAMRPGAVSGQRLDECESNLKTIGIALEKYRYRHEGRSPKSLEELVKGEFLSEIPSCPSAGSDTYSGGYEQTSEKTYRVTCQGENHADLEIPPDYPRITTP